MGLKTIVILLAIFYAFSSLAKESRQRIVKIATKAASEHGLDPKLVLAIIEVESNFNPKAVGRTHGELGLMQLRPEFHACASLEELANILCGVKYLSKLKSRFESRLGTAWFVRYNWGESRPLPAPKQTHYFRRVQRAIASQSF